jgi:hypothetical protein
LLLYYPPAIFFSFLARQPNSPNNADFTKRLLNVSLVALVTLPLLYLVTRGILHARITKVIAGSDHSTIVRLIVPPLLTIAILRDYPLFGMGLGGLHAVVDTTLRILQRVGLDPYLFLYSGDAARAFPITALQYWATFGLLGGSAIFYFLRQLQKIIAPNDGVAILVAILFISLAGDFVAAAPFTCTCSLLAAASYVRWRDASEIKDRRSRVRNASPNPAMAQTLRSTK